MTAKKAPNPVKKAPRGALVATKKQTDWDAIEADHNTGKYTDGQLATLHSLSREAICRKRKRDQTNDPRRWQKDLTDQVRQATNALLLRDQVTEDHNKITGVITAGHTATAILTAAEISKQVIVGHRADISKVRGLTMMMAEELGQVSTNQEQLESFFESIVVTKDMKPEQVMNARRAYNELVRLPSRIASAKNLAESLTKLQTLERRAFSLDEDDKGKNPMDDDSPSMTDAEMAVRLNYLFSKVQS